MYLEGGEIDPLFSLGSKNKKKKKTLLTDAVVAMKSMSFSEMSLDLTNFDTFFHRFNFLRHI